MKVDGLSPNDYMVAKERDRDSSMRTTFMSIKSGKSGKQLSKVSSGDLKLPKIRNIKKKLIHNLPRKPSK